MRDLKLGFRGPRITGSGIDLIAPFQLTGLVREDGAVELVKQYLGRHSVLYVGQYDGEGTLYGKWDIDGYRGDWSIKLLGPTEENLEEDIEQIVPNV